MADDEVERVVQAIKAAPGGSIDQDKLVRLLGSRSDAHQARFFASLRANPEVRRRLIAGRWRWVPRRWWEGSIR